jgi:hypothetical protein
MTEADELRAKLALLERQDADRRRDRDVAFHKYLRTTPLEWRATPSIYNEWTNGNTPIHGCRIECRIPEAGKEQWPDFATNDWFNWQGMFYYRTSENILYHKGGGMRVLDDPRLCNDTEWAGLLAGLIPAKFRKLK